MKQIIIFSQCLLLFILTAYTQPFNINATIEYDNSTTSGEYQIYRDYFTSYWRKSEAMDLSVGDLGRVLPLVLVCNEDVKGTQRTKKSIYKKFIIFAIVMENKKIVALQTQKKECNLARKRKVLFLK